MTPPVFAHGSLRLYLLALLAEQPRHGYELIQALSDRFGGSYIPSAGTIYPRLAKLEEEGLVSKETDGRKTTYSITDAGRAELEARRGELDSIEEAMTDSVRRIADEVRAGVNDAMRSLRADLASAARSAKQAGKTESAKAAASAGANAQAMQESARAMHDAELTLNQFRQEMRTELRTQAARANVPIEAATVLRERLDAVRAEVLGLLRAP
ncbi:MULTISPECIES: PadR family transcriptional regulator [Microterricola]|uniref:DNA-binding transcriptional regulator, PadR family n=2 Tax=Microterricola TaxID=518733 RepID=A0A1H1NXK1_9MICO|nr:MULTISPECIES: PadR family transcriptional regulator [Microterricola]PPL19078.1 PadR family transcriptional regulator [Microterricola pindariensis]SDS03089.1 DNA-binding transcriptional regulator, PadR family [Microterricola viridarii]